ncbi:MAG: phosphatidate cytidylyltransferase [Oscillospiraceae bacterium]|nr:phosphatidate cytidylyltransferase [Oscillospiraceae bacterium]
MKQRVITGVVLVVLLIAILALGTPFVEIAVVLLAAVGVIELFNATRLSGNKKLLLVSVAGTLVMVSAQCFGAHFFAPALYVYIVAMFIMYMANTGVMELKEIATAFFLAVYVSFMFAHIILVRNMDNGQLLIWLVLIGAFVTDTAALFAGKFFGRHKLCPKLSPKKTIEGSVGGVLGCVVATLIFCLVGKICFALEPDYIRAIIVALGASVISQLGDLSASCIKRQFGIKDYGKLMPGHGGVMDRFDSLFFVAPFVYYMMLVAPIFN